MALGSTWGAPRSYRFLRRLDLEPGAGQRLAPTSFARTLRASASREYRLHAGFVNLRPGLLGRAPGRGGRRDQPLGGDAPLVPWRRLRPPGPAPDRRGGRRPTGCAEMTKRAVPKAQPHRDPDFPTPDPKRDYFEWLRTNRVRLGLRGPVSPLLRDRAEFAWRDLSLRAHVALRIVPGLSGSGWWEGKARPPAPAPAKPHAAAGASCDRPGRSSRAAAPTCAAKGSERA